MLEHLYMLGHGDMHLAGLGKNAYTPGHVCGCLSLRLGVNCTCISIKAIRLQVYLHINGEEETLLVQ